MNEFRHPSFFRYQLKQVRYQLKQGPCVTVFSLSAYKKTLNWASSIPDFAYFFLVSGDAYVGKGF